MVSLAAHGVLLAVAVLLSHPAPAPPVRPGPLVLVPKPGARGGGAGPEAPPTKATKANGRKAPRPVRTPVETPRQSEPTSRPDSASSDGDGRDGTGRRDGSGTDGPGGEPECATPPCGGGGEVFSEDVVAAMPVLVSAPEVRLSGEALRSGVEGTMLVRCVITSTGTVDGCEVLKGVPLAEAAVLAALQGRQYRPAQIQGRPVSVRHLFTVRIKPGR